MAEIINSKTNDTTKNKNSKTNTKIDTDIKETAKKVLEFKTIAEANVVSILYKEPERIVDTNLTLNDFFNNCWRVYFEIAYEIIVGEKKNTLDDITIGLFLEKHDKLRAKYQEYGGYDTIVKATEYVKCENLDAYISELRKWTAVTKLCRDGFPVKQRLSDYADMNAEQIYSELEIVLNDTFVNIDSDVKSCSLSDGIYNLIEELDKGTALGLPFWNMPMLTKETGGQCLGTITLLGGISNVGKSLLTRSLTIPSIIEYNEKIVVMINEDSVKKWQREMLVWICNNIFDDDIQKHTVRDGRYSKEVKSKLYQAAEWLETKTKDHTITMIPFIQYSTDKAIKVIKKYAAMGVKHFVLDTFKLDAGKVSNDSWLEMQQNMVAIKDVIKAENLNVHILITFQLEKGSTRMRYYTQSNIGIAKNIVDVASTCLMVRDVFEDEYTDESKAIKVYKKEGGNTVQVKLYHDKKYQLFFIVKNQEGAANSYQIVLEHDKSRNKIKEIGIARLMPDGF